MHEFEKPYKYPSRVRSVLAFLLCPCAFTRLAATHDESWVLTHSPDLQKKFLSGEYKPDQSEIKKTAALRATALRRSLLRSGISVVGAALVSLAFGVVLSHVAGSITNKISSIIQGIGAGIILWATLWQLSRDMQSFGGCSLAERVHGWLFNFLYISGTALFFVVYTWQA
jgi:hypothetical protein